MRAARGVCGRKNVRIHRERAHTRHTHTRMHAAAAARCQPMCAHALFRVLSLLLPPLSGGACFSWRVCWRERLQTRKHSRTASRRCRVRHTHTHRTRKHACVRYSLLPSAVRVLVLTRARACAPLSPFVHATRSRARRVASAVGGGGHAPVSARGAACAQRGRCHLHTRPLRRFFPLF